MYPKPKEAGGILIRQAIRLLREFQVSLPISSDILIACSGGTDSLALAQLLLKYGRKIAPGGAKQIRLLHINHGWRAQESDADEKFVEEFSRSWGVECITHRLPTPLTSRKKSRRSGEEEARMLRKAIFRAEARKRGAQVRVLTAHQQQDLAETVLWRACTGALRTHGEGIRVSDGVEIRPFLRAPRELLVEFLKEENLIPRDDRSNRDPKFLRARMRLSLWPELAQIFPQAQMHLSEWGLRAQRDTHSDQSPEGELSRSIAQNITQSIAQNLEQRGVRMKRAHRLVLDQWLLEVREADAGVPHAWGAKRIQLPSGWIAERVRAESGRWEIRMYASESRSASNPRKNT
jgi:tRNA(Ile)-lysidine synthetase-like protein